MPMKMVAIMKLQQKRRRELPRRDDKVPQRRKPRLGRRKERSVYLEDLNSKEKPAKKAKNSVPPSMTHQSGSKKKRKQTTNAKVTKPRRMKLGM